MRRLLLATGIAAAVAALALAAGGAYLYVWSRDHADTIAKGVRIAGIDVGGLHAAQARALVGSRLRGRLSRPVTLVHGRHRFTVRPEKAGVRVDVAHMVAAAVDLSRRGGLLHRALRDLRGRPLDAAVPLHAAVSAARLETLAGNVAAVIDRPARNARVAPTATTLHVVRSRPGIAVKRPLLEQRLEHALLRLDGLRTIGVPTRPLHPHLPTASLAERYDTFILVDRETFTLRLFKHLKLARTYPVAVGQAGLETPAGLYSIDDKQVNPSWHVPQSAWAGDLAGRVIPPGPDDPIKARWLGFWDGAGIHGTDEISSIGSAASHGCIRMRIPDVEELYDLVPLHTPIYVG